MLGDLLLVGNMSNFCAEARGILQFVGWLLTIFRIAIPLIIIALGMFDFGKAVVASKDDEIKKQFKQLMMRLVAGVLIFFVPVFVMWVFGAVATFGQDENETDFNICYVCITAPWGCEGAQRHRNPGATAD